MRPYGAQPQPFPIESAAELEALHLKRKHEGLTVTTFGDPDQANLTGHYYRLPEGTQLPQGLAIKADGIDVESGTFPPTHHTIYPTEEMAPDRFIRLLGALPWEYRGKK